MSPTLTCASAKLSGLAAQSLRRTVNLTIGLSVLSYILTLQELNWNSSIPQTCSHESACGIHRLDTALQPCSQHVEPHRPASLEALCLLCFSQAARSAGRRQGAVPSHGCAWLQGWAATAPGRRDAEAATLGVDFASSISSCTAVVPSCGAAELWVRAKGRTSFISASMSPNRGVDRYRLSGKKCSQA